MAFKSQFRRNDVQLFLVDCQWLLGLGHYLPGIEQYFLASSASYIDYSIFDRQSNLLARR
jgi:hypothetical protein